MDPKEKTFACPSSSKRVPDVKVFGVVNNASGSSRVTYLDRLLPLDEVIGPLDAGNIDPSEFLRLTGPCFESGCANFKNNQCGVAQRMMESKAPVLAELPVCGIRKDCRWFAEHQGEACVRCPQVVTQRHILAPTESGPA